MYHCASAESGSAPSHAECAVDVGEVGVVFERNGLSRPAAAARGIGGRVQTDGFARWVARLRDEIVDGAVEEDTVVET